MALPLILTTTEPADLPALARLPGLGGALPPRIALEGLIFDSAGQMLVMQRGAACRDEAGLLEGVGGRLEPGDSFRAGLLREFSEELGDQITIRIEQFVHARLQAFHDRVAGAEVDWLILSYRCRWIAGQPLIREPENCDALVIARPEVLPADRMAASLRFVRDCGCLTALAEASPPFSAVIQEAY